MNRLRMRMCRLNMRWSSPQGLLLTCVSRLAPQRKEAGAGNPSENGKEMTEDCVDSPTYLLGNLN